MRIMDWSSDVCSSDLTIPETPLYAWWINDPAWTPASGVKRTMALTMGNHAGEPLGDLNAFEGIEYLCSSDTQSNNVRQHFKTLCLGQIGMASCRESVCQYV